VGVVKRPPVRTGDPSNEVAATDARLVRVRERLARCERRCDDLRMTEITGGASFIGPALLAAWLRRQERRLTRGRPAREDGAP
jgi:hypothetical protein